MLLLVFFLDPLKKWMLLPEILASHFSRPYIRFIYYGFSLQKNVLLGFFFASTLPYYNWFCQVEQQQL